MGKMLIAPPPLVQTSVRWQKKKYRVTVYERGNGNAWVEIMDTDKRSFREYSYREFPVWGNGVWNKTAIIRVLEHYKSGARSNWFSRVVMTYEEE